MRITHCDQSRTNSRLGSGVTTCALRNVTGDKILEDKIRKAVTEMETAGKKPSVRTVREIVGRGSHTDKGDCADVAFFAG
jgi:hypothetical protein